MRKVYADLPVKVKPFYIAAEDLTADRLLTLMHCEEDGKLPLYMVSIRV